METVFMNTKNSKTNEPHGFRLTLTDKLNLEDPKKCMTLANLSICYKWKNIKSSYNNNKFKYLLQPGTMILNYLMDHILFQTFIAIFDYIIKNTKL